MFNESVEYFYYLIKTEYYFLLTNSIKSTSLPNNTSVGFILPSSGPFSNFKTPLGQTAEQIPQPTQLDRDWETMYY